MACSATRANKRRNVGLAGRGILAGGGAAQAQGGALARREPAGDDPQQCEERILAHAPAVVGHRVKVLRERRQLEGLQCAAHWHSRLDRRERGFEMLSLQAASRVFDQFTQEEPLGPVMIFVEVARLAAVAVGLPHFAPARRPIHGAWQRSGSTKIATASTG